MKTNEPGSKSSNRRIQTYVFSGILILLLLGVFRIFAPFFSVLLWSTLIYILLNPLNKRLTQKLDTKKLKGKILKNFWAAALALGAMFIILIPLSFVLVLFFRQVIDLGQHIRDMLNHNPDDLYNLLEKVFAALNNISGGIIELNTADIFGKLTVFLRSELQRIVAISGSIVKNIGGFSINLLLVLFTLYFFFMDGNYLSGLALRAIPIKKEYMSALKAKFSDIIRNLFFGYIIVALMQAVCAFIIYSIFGIRGALVFAFITFILVFIPMVGAGMIYIPLVISFIMKGEVTKGIVFLCVSVVFITGIDNVVRPLFLKGRIQLHPLIILFAILGGIIAFGFNGLVLGPMLVILFLTVLDMFLMEHKIPDTPQDP